MATIIHIVLRFPEWSDGLRGWQIAVYLKMTTMIKNVGIHYEYPFYYCDIIIYLLGWENMDLSIFDYFMLQAIVYITFIIYTLKDHVNEIRIHLNHFNIRLFWIIQV